MKNVEFTIEKCCDTKQYVGIIPGISGAHSQGDSIKSLLDNLKEVCELLDVKDVLLTGQYEGAAYKMTL
ncbi:type II toxin-antitoxin system HicB family antitoxin [Methylophilus sp. 13]|uniref:type II toxin-antitoxin system HicB family antitoxin n=1 Tax=Methylophilus sp. 13 TaxID=2781018 RepID=UPI00188FBE13|nr:type II toxin-antitoxin system HicB family antitoxin [Methylophilus sp. 13]MBF5039370.1 type II toxin-antitoxin system HicB family antitoxin [Methylophilus sp. 13]